MITLPIDQKSLFYNIKNDNKTGHTATVATPLKQGNSFHDELLNIYDIPENINPVSRESLITKIVSGSRAMVRIPNIFVFDNISINGIPIESKHSFCIYIREEIDPNNFHCGRLKIHYPQSFIFSDEVISINNKLIIKEASKVLKDYAFVVEKFEYNTKNKVLNLDAVVIGQNDTPYSKVFVNKKGVGNKFSPIFNEFADNYDAEIIALREQLGYDKVATDNFMDIQFENKKKALDFIEEALLKKGFSEFKCINDKYPYSLYDIEYKENGVKKYIILNVTATKIHYFGLSANKIRFIDDFKDKVQVVLITDVLGNPTTHWYDSEDLQNMTKSISSIIYTER